VCGGDETRVLGIDNGFTVRKCIRTDCEFVYVNPRPTREQLDGLYRTFYHEEKEVPDKWKWEMNAVFRESCDWLTEWRATGTVLDVGCAYGHFLQLMQARGWLPTGVEPSPTAARYAQEHVRGPIIQANFEDADLGGRSFDAVTSFYVLEHASEPRQFLAKIHEVLRRGGLAIIRIPYTAPLFPINRLMRRSLMYAPMHLNDFSPRAMRRLALDLGFRTVEHRVGAPRRSHELMEQMGARLLGGFGRLVEHLSHGRLLFPYVGALSYRLWK
jgi:SAM-dependent methyltransferase